MEFFIALVNIVALGFIAWRVWLLESSPFRKVFWPALLFKLLAGILLGLIYTYYYTSSDTLIFFRGGTVLARLAAEDFGDYLYYLWNKTDGPYSGENRTIFFVKIVSLFSLLTHYNYWVTSLYFSFISFLSAWWLVAVIRKKFPELTWPASFAFLFFPSCVFWSSGIIKESIALAALFFLVALFIRFWTRDKISMVIWVLALIVLWILWSLKYFYAAVFLPVVASAWLTRWFAEQRMRPIARTPYREFLLMVVLLMVFLFVVTFVHPNFYPQRILQVILDNHNVFANLIIPANDIHYINLQPTFGSVLINAPWALFSALFRPFLWEVSNVPQLVASLENLLLLTLTIISFKNYHQMDNSSQRMLWFALILYCVILAVFLALSTPNFGTLARFRVGFLPFWVMMTSCHPFVIGILSKLFRMN